MGIILTVLKCDRAGANVAVERLPLRLRVREVPSSVPGWETGYADFRGFPQARQTNSRMVPSITVQPLLSTYSTIVCPLIIQSFEATYVIMANRSVFKRTKKTNKIYNGADGEEYGRSTDEETFVLIYIYI
jgi:hypothetical protein